MVHKLIHEKTHAQRSQLILVIVGTAIAFLFGMYFNLILPWLNVYEYIWLGPCFSLIMIFSMGYTIIRHNLFNIKIVTTKISVFLILFFIFIRFLITDGVEEKVIEVTLFVVTTIAGMFLIKSVEKEIDAREEIEALVGRLKIANEHLRELDKQKTEFVSIASHQLRTPLTAIKGYVSMILDGSFGALEEGVKEPVKRIFHSSERLSGTVEDFLNVTRIEQGRMQYEMMDTDICSLTKEAVEELTYAAEEKHISLSLVCDLKEYAISADREKLRQVVLNLIDNAIKYTPKGGVSVHVFEKTTGRRTFAVIEISDTGIGIPYTFMNEIFGKFNRGENSPMYYANGSGIGLYIANEIVRAHHGAIEVKSKEGEGAVFSVMLPQKNSPISETRESPEDVEKVKKEQTNK